MAERILVQFSGVESGTEVLTWGQEHIIRSMLAAGSSLSMSAVRTLTDAVTIDEIAGELRFYVSRFQAMRTRLRFEPDGRILQVVAGAGEIPIEVIDLAAAADPARVADEVVRQHDDTPFDYVSEWPVRMVVLRREGVLTHLVMTLSHHVADGAAALVMFTDYLNRDPLTGRARGPVAATQPLQLARQQREPAARRQSDAALRYWEGLLRTIPPRRFGEPDGGADRRGHDESGGHRHWRLVFESPAMFLALRAVAARTNADPQSILLATYAVALARITGRGPVVAQLLVSNRFRPGFADMVGPLIQPGLCVIDVADDITFDEAVARARRRALTAYKYAYYDKIQLNELIARVQRERGEPIDLGCIYNDRRGQAVLTTHGPVPTEDEVRAALPRTTLVWEKRLAQFNERLMMNFNDGRDAVAVQVTVDTHHLPPTELKAYLRELETVAIEAAFDPSPSTKVCMTPSSA